MEAGWCLYTTPLPPLSVHTTVSVCSKVCPSIDSLPLYLVEAKRPMRVNISFVDQLELPGRAHEELSGVNQVTDGACSDYRCAVNIIPAWVGVQVSMKDP